MSFGKLYTKGDNPRSTAIKVVAEANGLKLDIVETETGAAATADYKLINKLGKIPSFVGADGYVLSECIAIAIYITSQNEKTTLLGKTKQDYASILKWLSFANQEILPKIGAWWPAVTGKTPYNKKVVDEAEKDATAAVATLEDYLLVNTYLVGERLTLADIFVAALLYRGFQYFFDKTWRSSHPNTTRWYETVINQEIYKSAPKVDFIAEAVKYTPPKKEAAPKKEVKKAEPKPKAAAAADDEEDEPREAPKAKHPLELLPRSTFVIDDWKRKYSNEETDVALKWFWENANFEEYSIWRVDYKYNEELTQTFMSANLVGGFFARLEGSRKYIFGAASVYGTANDSIIQGAFFVRGQEADPAFDVAPDYESYSVKKLDPKNAEDRAFLESMWTWDKPIVVSGKEYPHADGKVFK